jgi:hypothetical protein
MQLETIFDSASHTKTVRPSRASIGTPDPLSPLKRLGDGR